MTTTPPPPSPGGYYPPAGGYAPQGRLSKSSLFSLIFGILSCIPASGLLAMLLGIIGFVKTGKPGVTGRWMAIVGGILGLIGTIAWALFGATIVAAVLAAIGMTEAPRAAAHEFLRDLAAGDVASCVAKSEGISEDDLKEFVEIMKANGTYQDTTFTNVRRHNNEAVLEGTATFSGGRKRVEMSLTETNGVWKVDGIALRNP